MFLMFRRATARSRMRAGVTSSRRCLPIAPPYACLTRSRVSSITSDAWASSGTQRCLAWRRTGQCVDAGGEHVDLSGTVEGADFDVVGPCLTGAEEAKLTSLAGVEPAGVAVGSRLHGHAIGALAEHPPHRVKRELVAPIDLVGAEAEVTIDDRHRNCAFRL